MFAHWSVVPTPTIQPKDSTNAIENAIHVIYGINEKKKKNFKASLMNMNWMKYTFHNINYPPNGWLST